MFSFYEQFLLFPQCFLSVWRTFCHFRKVQNCRLQTLSIWESLNFVVWERVNLHQATKWTSADNEIDLHVYTIQKLKLVFWEALWWEKENTLVTRILSFPSHYFPKLFAPGSLKVGIVR